MKRGADAGRAALLTVLTILLAGGVTVSARSSELPGAAGAMVRIDAHFVDRASGAEAGWGATGQLLVSAQPGDPALRRWRQPPTVSISLARQNVTLARGGRGLIRIGREIPFAGWFLHHGTRCGWLEPGTEWREVESALELEAWSLASDGTIRLVIVPEFSYLAGRSRRFVSFVGERIEIALVPGVEARFAPIATLEAFYGRLLAGYDPLRRVWPVELILHADLIDPEP